MKPRRTLIALSLILMLLVGATPSFGGGYSETRKSVEDFSHFSSRPIDLPTTQQAKLLAADKANWENMGNAVALSADGTIALVGAYDEDTSPTIDNGAAYVFIRSGGGWLQQAKIMEPSGGHSTAFFGRSVALSADGKTALIGAPQTDVWGRTDCGSAYIYTYANNVWGLEAQITPADIEPTDEFGWAAALSADGNTALISAHLDDTDTTTNNGRAFIYTRSGSVWSQMSALLAPGYDDNENFGQSVALSADGLMALVGADKTSVNGNANAGAAFIYTRGATSWPLESILVASDWASDDQFGWSVALSNTGDTALVGAFHHQEPSFNNAGAAYVYIRSGGNWPQQAKLSANPLSTSAYFGSAVSLSANGNVALVGAYVENDGGFLENGAAYIYSRSGSSWSPQLKLLAADKASNDNFGTAVALSSDGNTALIGAPGESDSGTLNNGAAYIFGDPSLVTPTPTMTPTPLPPRADTVGVYKDGIFYLRNSNSAGTPDITAYFGGDASDLPVVGDWNGDGIDTIGVYRNSTGFFFLSNSNTAPAVNYTVLLGNPSDTPFAGKWRSDMTGDGLGVFRPSNGILYQKRDLTSGFSDYFAVFGNPSDVGFAGDWNNDGKDSIGIYRRSETQWYMTNNSEPSGITFSDINFQWNIGGTASVPVVGDWNADGITTVGYLNTNAGEFELHSTLSFTGLDTNFAFGPVGGKPVAGRWIAGSYPSFSAITHPIGDGHNAAEHGDID